jgi:hypothetical protein
LPTNWEVAVVIGASPLSSFVAMARVRYATKPGAAGRFQENQLFMNLENRATSTPTHQPTQRVLAMLAGVISPTK